MLPVMSLQSTTSSAAAICTGGSATADVMTDDVDAAQPASVAAATAPLPSLAHAPSLAHVPSLAHALAVRFADAARNIASVVARVIASVTTVADAVTQIEQSRQIDGFLEWPFNESARFAPPCVTADTKALAQRGDERYGRPLNTGRLQRTTLMMAFARLRIHRLILVRAARAVVIVAGYAGLFSILGQAAIAGEGPTPAPGDGPVHVFCTFEQGHSWSYDAGKFQSAAPSKLSFEIAAIDLDGQSARLVMDGKPSGTLRVVRALNANHFLEVANEGFLNLTTIYDFDPTTSSYPAVHSRHFGILGQPVFGQYVGACAPKTGP